MSEIYSIPLTELVKEVFFNGRKQADIARELGVGKTAVRNRLQKIFEKMQKSL